MRDSGIKAKAAAPRSAPAESEIKIHNFLWFNSIINVEPAPNSADTKARNDLNRINRTI